MFGWRLSAQHDSRGAISTKITSNSVGEKRALVIGISDYQSNELKLNYADNDAFMFKNFLAQVEKVSDENICFLANEEATGMRIAQELKRIYAQSVSGDIVYIYFAGHGDVVDDFDEKIGYLLAFDSNANQEYNGVGGVVPLAYLNDKVLPKLTEKGIKVFLILDACRSGFIYKEGTQKNMGAIQSMFEQSIKFLSCGPNELSYESSELKHGYFTYYLIKGLAGEADSNLDSKIQYNEIDNYLYDKVNQSVSQKYHQSQIPTIKTQNSREVYKTVTLEDKSIVFGNLPKQNSPKADRVRGVLPTNVKDEVYEQVYQEFSDALRRKDFYGKPKSALELYNSAKLNPKIPSDLLTAMQSKLIEKLANSAQNLINDYINGNRDLPFANEFLKQAKHLEICLQLMDKEDYMYPRITASKLLLESYAVIRSKNYPGIKKAKNKLKEALSIVPNAAYIHNAMGMIYSWEQKNDSAHYHFNEARKLISTWSTPVHNISDNLISQNKFEEAKQLIDSSLGVKGVNANTYIQLGIVYENEGKYQLAEENYKKALTTQPNSSFIAQKLSNLYASKGAIIESQKWLDKAVQTDTLATLLRAGIAKYSSDHKIDLKQTESIFIQAIEQHPDLAELYTQYADFIALHYFNLQRKVLADSLYTKAIALDPYHVAAYSGKAWLNFKMRKKLESKKIMEEAIQNNPSQPLAYFNYADFLYEAYNDVQGAKQNYLKAIALNRLYMPSHTKLVGLAIQQNQVDEAIRFLTQILIKHKEVPDLWNLLGDCYFHSGNFTAAVEAYNQALISDPTYAKVYSKLGKTELETNQFADAKNNYLLANLHNPYVNKKSDIAAYIIAMAKEKQRFGTPLQTRNLYKLAFEIDPTPTNGWLYANYLYLNQNPQEAITVSLSLLQNECSNKDKNDLIKLIVKSAIDLDDKKMCALYSKKLVFNENDQLDVLLTAVYCRYIGNDTCYDSTIIKVNQRFLGSNELKEHYSMHTIQNYILRP